MFYYSSFWQVCFMVFLHTYLHAFKDTLKNLKGNLLLIILSDWIKLISRDHS